jgi:hypothetical protein
MLEKILIIFCNILVIAAMAIIIAYFRLDRMTLSIEMKWKNAKMDFRELAEGLAGANGGEAPDIVREKAEEFLRTKRTRPQMTAAAELARLLNADSGIKPSAELAGLCEYYNARVREFNKKIQSPFWQFEARLFRRSAYTEILF